MSVCFDRGALASAQSASSATSGRRLPLASQHHYPFALSPSLMLKPETLPKDVKALPPEAQRAFLDAYNRDFGMRCSEGHAEKAAWRVVHSRWPIAPPPAAPKA